MRPLDRVIAGAALVGSLAAAGCAARHYQQFDAAPPTRAATPTATGPVEPVSARAAPSPPAAEGPADDWQGGTIDGAGAAPSPPAAEGPAGRHSPEGFGGAAVAAVRPPAAPDRPATRLTLDQVINAVLVTDPRLRAGFEAINQAHADALTASLRPNPTLYLDIQLLPLTRPFTPDATGGPPQQDVNLTYPIDWYLFGKRAANMAAAAQGVRVSEAEFADRVRLRVGDAVAGFYDVLEARALAAAAREHVARLEPVEAAVARAVGAGVRSRLELNRVRLDLLRGRQAVRDADTVLVTARARLRALIGRSDHDPGFDVEGDLGAARAADPPPPEEAFDTAVRTRPDLVAAGLRTAQARAAAEAERRKAYPDVVPTVGYTRQYQVGPLGQPDANSWTAALSMSLPVSNRNQGGRAKAAAVVAQAELQYRAALADLRAELDTADRQLRAARANAESAAGDQARLARELLAGVTAGYQVGDQSLADLLDAHRDVRDAARLSVSARAAYWRAVYRYATVLGQTLAP